MKCQSCGGITIRPDASKCRHCGASFVDPLENDHATEVPHSTGRFEKDADSFERASRGPWQTAFTIAVIVWYLPLGVGMLGFFANGFHPEGLRAWLMARNGPVLIFTVGEDPTKVFLLPVIFEVLVLPLFFVFRRVRRVWPLGLFTLLTILWAFLGAAVFALS